MPIALGAWRAGGALGLPPPIQDPGARRTTDESPITHTLREWLKSMGYGNYGIWERLYAQFCKSGSPESYGLWEIMGYRSYGLSEIHLYLNER